MPSKPQHLAKALILAASLALPSPALTIVTYNVAGNGVSDWSTNSLQVQAIGRQMAALQPDVVTFNEIPYSKSWQMTNFANVWLPGYSVARNSGTDNFICSVILSRYPIVRSTSWLDGVSLTNFGYSGSYTRDLFEAEIAVPDAPANLHVFTTHLKAYEDATSASRRAAEASAISNHLISVFLPQYAGRPYVLTGDLNEDVFRPPSTSKGPIQRLVNPATGLALLTPTNALSGDVTLSIRGSLNKRFDYVLASTALVSSVRTSYVFRADMQPALLGVGTNDSVTASDHLPVVVDFDYPVVPFLVDGSMSNGVLTLNWPGMEGQSYTVEGSSDFTNWVPLVSNATAGGTAITADMPEMTWFFRVKR